MHIQPQQFSVSKGSVTSQHVPDKVSVPELRRASLMTQRVKNPPTLREPWVQFLGLEDPLEKGMATYYSILAWRIPWTEEPGRLQSMESQRVRHDWVAFPFSFSLPSESTTKVQEEVLDLRNRALSYLLNLIISASNSIH